MKKLVFIFVSMLGTLLTAQVPQLQVTPAGIAETSYIQNYSESPQQRAASATVNDTLDYFFAKHYFRNSTTGGANTSFYTLKSPYQTNLNIQHCGAVFLNNTSITVTGLKGLVLKHPTSPSASVPFRIYLCNVNASNLPIFPPLDSVQTSVSNPTAGVWCGGTFTAPVPINGNFAVLFKCSSTVSSDTIRLFLNNANTPTSSAASAIKYGEGLGLIRFSGIFQSNTNTFGSGTDYEFVVAPYVSYNISAGAMALTSTVCPGVQASFTNVTTPMSLIESRFFNLNKFKPFWAPTNSAMPSVTDSIYNWTFSGSSTPPTTVKNPGAIFTTLGNQGATLTVRIKTFRSSPALFTNKTDMSVATISVSNGSAPPLTVSGNTAFCSNGFVSTTLTANGASSYTWSNPITVTSSIVVTASAPVQYTVMSQNLGCYAIKVVTVMVSPIPSVTLDASTNAICSMVTGGSTIALTGIPSGGNFSGTNVVGPKFTPSGTGTFAPVYSYTDQATGCANTATVKISVTNCTGLTELSSLSNISVYPNPAKGGKVKIKGLDNSGSILVIDAIGRKAIECNYENGVCDIDLSGLIEGNYFLQVRSATGAQATLRIVNQH